MRALPGSRTPLLAALLALLAAAPASHAAQPDAAQDEHSVPARLAPRSLLLDVAAAGERLVAVGERGHVLLSDDQGRSWRQVVVPTRVMLTGVWFSGARHGWAVGHDAVILRTADGGEHWEKVYSAPEERRPLLDVWFADARHGYAVGAYGYFLETSDGGATWHERRVREDEDFHLNQIAAAGGGRLYMAAEAGTVYRSGDGGRHWESLPSPYEGSFFGSLPLGDDTLLLFGLRGHLFRSADAGESWSAVQTGTEAMLTGALRLRDGGIVIVGLAGTMLLSRDGGEHFVLQQLEDREGIARALQTADGGLVLVGENGVRRLRLEQIFGPAAAPAAAGGRPSLLRDPGVRPAPLTRHGRATPHA